MSWSDAMRPTVPVSRVRLPRTLVVLLVLAAFTGGALRSAPAASARTADAAPLDLAAMTLTPADLAQAGQEGFGVSFGRTLSVDDLAYRAVWPAGEGEELAAVRDELLAAGWNRAYVGVLTTVRNYDDPEPIRDVEVEVVVYADAEGATAGFALIPDAYPTGEMEEVRGTTTIGDESRITRIDAHDPGSGTPFAELALGFRHGPLTVRVLLRNPVEDPPAIAEIEALGEALLARIEHVRRDGGPGLSLRALRVEPREAWTLATDEYLRLDGEDRRSAYETPEAFGDRAAAYGDAVDVFESATEIPANDSGYTLGFRSTLYRFAGEDQASAWLQEAPDRLRQEPDVTELEAEAEVGGVGDEAVAVTMTRDRSSAGGDITRSAIVVVRVAAVVAEIRLDRAYDAPSRAAALDLARGQAACLEADACLSLLPAPISLTGDLEGDTYASPVLSHCTPAAGSEITFDAYAGNQGPSVLAVRLVIVDLDVVRKHLALLPDLLGHLDRSGCAGALSARAPQT